MLKNLTRALLTGLSLLLPIILSLQLLIWLLMTVESWLRLAWEFLLPDGWYLPGMASLAFLILATGLGLSIRLRGVRPLWNRVSGLVERVPVLNIIHGTIRDFFDLMQGDTFSGQSIVWVTLPDTPYRLLGMVTRQGDGDGSQLSRIMNSEEVAVYLPMSYQMGGYMVVVPKKDVEEVDIEPAEALRLIVSAGLGQKKRSPPSL